MLFRLRTPKFIFTGLTHTGRYFFFVFFGKRLASFGKTNLQFCFLRKRAMLLSFTTFSRIVNRGMFSALHYFEIFKAIICNVAVDMMNMFISGKLSAKMVFYYKSMLKNFSAIYADHLISSNHPSFSVGCPPFIKTVARAESSFSKLGRISLVHFPTIQASNLNFRHVGIIPQIKTVS